MMREPHHGDSAKCAICKQTIEFYQYAVHNGFEYDILDEWWSHTVHPDDNHDAVFE